MKYLLIIVGVAVLAFTVKKLYAYQAAYNSCFENIDNSRFKELASMPEEVLILDVRTAQEYQQGKIKAALNIDVLQQDFEKNIATLDPSKTVLVYCRSGSRSLKACQILCNNGFKKVYNLSNGYMGWSE